MTTEPNVIHVRDGVNIPQATATQLQLPCTKASGKAPVSLALPCVSAGLHNLKYVACDTKLTNHQAHMTTTVITAKHPHRGVFLLAKAYLCGQTSPQQRHVCTQRTVGKYYGRVTIAATRINHRLPTEPWHWCECCLNKLFISTKAKLTSVVAAANKHVSGCPQQ